MTDDDRPVFYYDLGSPYAWLTAERIHDVMPVTPVWQPILLGGIWQQTGGGSWSLTDARAEGIAEVERRAREYELMDVRWPEGWPPSGAWWPTCGRCAPTSTSRRPSTGRTTSTPRCTATCSPS